jgi:hypothetical protein
LPGLLPPGMGFAEEGAATVAGFDEKAAATAAAAAAMAEGSYLLPLSSPATSAPMPLFAASLGQGDSEHQAGGDPRSAPTSASVCPTSMNGEHCYQSRANVSACVQCGVRQ